MDRHSAVHSGTVGRYSVGVSWRTSSRGLAFSARVIAPCPSPSIITSDVAIVLGQYGGQLKRLEIYTRKNSESMSQATLAGLEPFPSLETLTISALQPEGPEDFNGFPLAELLEFLRLAPNLVQCELQTIDTCYSDKDPENVLLPRLLHLTFGETGLRVIYPEARYSDLRCFSRILHFLPWKHSPFRSAGYRTTIFHSS